MGENTKVDFIVVGGGMAGVVMCEELISRGHSLLCSHIAKPNSASPAAAGSMNPIAMKRIIMSWRAAQMMVSSTLFYRELEKTFSQKLITQIAAERIHASEDERALWQQRELEQPVGEHISPGQANSELKTPHGTGRIPECYWLNVQQLLTAFAQNREGLLTSRWWQELSQEHPEAKIIHCTGPFDDIPGLVPVQGEVLTLRIPRLNMDHSAHRSGFLIPLGNDLYRLGSTFEWKDVWAGKTDSGKTQLLAKLEHMIELPFELVDHWAGTRPTTKDRRPILGVHPKHSGHYVLNGLGSKGAMLAPWCAKQLADYILIGTAIDKEVDSTRFD